MTMPPQEWPPCPTPDCEYRVCLWGGTGVCYKCSVQQFGLTEMLHRYAATRVGNGDLRWNGSVFK